MMMQSPHRHVLEATPDTEESKAKLVEELQSRGRAAVGASSWMDAKLLYEKALTVVSAEVDRDASRVAILNSNLSLVHKNMGSFEAARQAAAAATKADATYVKGWWRLGQALQSLHRHEEALTALTKAKELDPTNKALIKEHAKVETKAKEDAALMKEQLAEAAAKAAVQEPMPVDVGVDVDETPAFTTKRTTQATSKTSTTTTTTTTTSTIAAATEKMSVDHDDDDDDDDDDEKMFTKSDAVRGYKVVNGKKTSYFHNELSEEAKTLIGDIAPKKLEPTAATPATSTGGASAWNQAGTWEERDLTKWAKTTLEEHILQTKYILPESSPAPGAQVTVTKVKTLDGHASVALARGKKRYIYEFMAKLDWKLESMSSTSDLECTGSLALPDIDGTIDLGEGYEIHEFVIDSVSENSLRPLVERFVQRGGFHEALNESIDNWVRRFKDEY